MAFLGKLKSSLGKISLKRKVGGTFFGNLLRTVAKSYTGGMLGNGAMMLKDGETPEDANSRLMQGVGAGVAAGVDAAEDAPSKKGSALDSFTSGATMQKIKQYALPVAGGIAGLMVLKAILSRGKN